MSGPPERVGGRGPASVSKVLVLTRLTRGQGQDPSVAFSVAAFPLEMVLILSSKLF